MHVQVLVHYPSRNDEKTYEICYTNSYNNIIVIIALVVITFAFKRNA